MKNLGLLFVLLCVGALIIGCAPKESTPAGGEGSAVTEPVAGETAEPAAGETAEPAADAAAPAADAAAPAADAAAPAADAAAPATNP